VPERAALPRTAGGAPPGCWCPRWLRSCANPPPRSAAPPVYSQLVPTGRPVSPALQMWPPMDAGFAE